MLASPDLCCRVFALLLGTLSICLFSGQLCCVWFRRVSIKTTGASLSLCLLSWFPLASHTGRSRDIFLSFLDLLAFPGLSPVQRTHGGVPGSSCSPTLQFKNSSRNSVCTKRCRSTRRNAADQPEIRTWGRARCPSAPGSPWDWTWWEQRAVPSLLLLLSPPGSQWKSSHDIFGTCSYSVLTPVPDNTDPIAYLWKFIHHVCFLFLSQLHAFFPPPS